jgi:hypothetical protein
MGTARDSVATIMAFSPDELARLSEQERAELLHLLLQTSGPQAARGNPRARRRFLIFVALCVVVLVIWIVTLGLTLPPDETTKQWRLAWVGFDVAELVAFTAAGWAAWRGRQLLIPALLVLGTLLFCDAWFDVVLSWNGDERWSSVASAALVEVPLAALFWLLARRLVLATVAAVRAQAGVPEPPSSLRALRLFEPLFDRPARGAQRP